MRAALFLAVGNHKIDFVVTAYPPGSLYNSVCISQRHTIPLSVTVRVENHAWHNSTDTIQVRMYGFFHRV
jgi:hypothetical protein